VNADERDRWQAVLDRAELREIALRYARAIDRHDRDLLLTCYHEDAVDHHGTVFRGNPSSYATWLRETMRQFEVTAHYIVNTDYRIAGELAEGEIYFLAYHRTVPPERRELFVGGRYHDRYERRGGEWRIAHRTIAWDFSRSSPLEDSQLTFLASLGVLGSRGDDISFESLPMFSSRPRGGPSS
jgi:3-phenylpropionate/cinnamic acid dioxygenase small subunit